MKGILRLVSIYLKPYEPWINWLIDIEEHEDDIELKPGMILEQMVSGCKYIMTNNGLYYGEWYLELKIVKHSKN